MLSIPLQKRMANLVSSLQMSTMSDDWWRQCREVACSWCKKLKAKASQPAGPQVFFFESNGSFIPSKNKSGTNLPPRADNDNSSRSHRGDSFLIQEKKTNNLHNLHNVLIDTGWKGNPLDRSYRRGCLDKGTECFHDEQKSGMAPVGTSLKIGKVVDWPPFEQIIAQTR